MCLNLGMGFGNSKLVLFFLLVGTITTLYRQFEKITMDLNDVKSKSAQVSQMHNNVKQLRENVVDLKKKLSESEEEVKRLRSEINLHKKDMTGLVDFAYGGRVISVGDTETYETEGLSIFGFRICGQANLERRILENSVMPGDCWPFKGHEGLAVIELINEIIVTKISLEHASKELLPNATITSAPSEFSLWGISSESTKGNVSPHFFGQFVYKVSGTEVQTFAVKNPSTRLFKRVELRIHSNNGNPYFTCIYRVRVHGIIK